ncbi:MAG: histidinol dehydrogenase, partial [Candidatus Electrothrix sp. GM3_4]|nr:histidinol dehydrogenase [Candidatus Electrothrix sp. GM3_4]
MTIRIEKYASEQGKKRMDGLRDRFALADSNCAQTVTDILEQVRSRGDEAIVEYTRRFDAPDMKQEGFKVSEEEFEQAAENVDDDFMATLAFAAERIRLFHEREMEESWLLTRDDGTITGRLVRPVDSAGLYVPGGQGGSTPLVSSVLMNAIPAGIAGVQQRIMMTPPNKEGKIAPALLMAAREVGVTEVYKAGSAWAIAALAFGTESVPAVDVIVGPGNQFVTEAKRQVMGRVRIDMIAGPSEVLIVADHAANPAYIAADMLAQAEHDPMALALLLTTETSVAEAV